MMTGMNTADRKFKTIGALKGLVFINLGSFLAQVVQVGGYPTLLTLTMLRHGFEAWLIGLITATQWAAVLLLAPFIPWILRRLGNRGTSQLGVGFSLMALMLLLFDTTSIAIVAVSANLMGIGLTMRWVACDNWIVHSARQSAIGRAIAMHETVMGLGIAIGPLLTMISNVSLPLALCLFMAILALSMIALHFGSRVPAQSAPMDAPPGGLRPIIRLVALALIAALASGSIETAMIALLPLYLLSFQHAEMTALALVSAFGIGGTILQLPLGWMADRYGHSSAEVLSIAIILVGAVALILAINQPVSLALILFFWVGAIGGLNTLAVIAVGRQLPPAQSASGVALVASAYTLGGVIGPLLSGLAMPMAGGHGAILLIIVLMLAYGLAHITHQIWRR